MNQIDWAIAISLWLVATVIAIINGYVGDTYIARLYGLYPAHLYKTLGAVLAVMLVAWLHARQTQGGHWYAAALEVGAIWVTLSIMFRFVVGRFIFGNSWRKLWSDYYFWRGRLWVWVLMAEAIAPPLMGWFVNHAG
ncbi:MAG TPA: hypothetical protein IGS37_10835 [Synechococcales cyanobacterium M55_K2018_004]|nr:hypothetical protein [Synechococcales cyanobacterium M55_K2018_004]